MIDSENITDEELVKETLRRPFMYGVLVNRYEDKLRRYIRRVAPVLRYSIDDVLQDIFVKAYEHLRGFDLSLSFSSWMYRIAHNHVVSLLRKQDVRKGTVELGEDEVHLFEKAFEVDGTAQRVSLDRDAVERSMAELGREYREVLTLYYFEEKKYEEMRVALTEENFNTLVRIHELMASGDYEAARDLREELDIPFGPRPGMGHGMGMMRGLQR